ncbi:hypothetical protein GCM10027060_01750 [Nesterenkonia halophila]|uniref:cell division protein FtsQ/DivIB n=1 Tax=Nesterenkonia halophila TaxID=302044 RepID=UPI0012915273|nr:FtsQ-type POTRA domain-containing protein [Nesterenkonia halophila]
MSPRPPRRPRSTGPPREGRSAAEAPDPAPDRDIEGPAAAPVEEAGAAEAAPSDAADTVVPLTRDVPLVAGLRAGSGAATGERRSRAARRGPEAGDDAEHLAEHSAEHPGGSTGGNAGGEAEEEPEQRPEAAADLLAFPEPEVVVLRRRRRRGALLVLAGLAVLLVVVLVLVFSPLLTVRQVQVEGNDLLTDSKAEELLEPALGRPMPQVGDGRVAELLDEEPVVADVVVQGELPDTLRVEVTEHPPVARVHRDGQVEYFTAEGEVIRSWPEDEAPAEDAYATPEIASDAALDHRAVFETIVGVLGELPSAARKSMQSATADSVDSVRLRLDDGRTVLWGGEDRGAQKAAVLAALLESDAEEFTEVDTIDISDPEAPVTR